MAGFLSSLNPTPAFPAYPGPHKVGTVDVEIPVAHLPPSTTTPADASATVSFRIFYPCQDQKESTRPVRWIPSPQRPNISAFARLLGAGSRAADFFAYFPTILYYISIPAQRNAPLLAPTTTNKRWPVMIFSHGLAGSRNLYSHVCGSMASYGLVVIAMDHRDGSSPVQYIRATSDTPSKVVDEIKIPHSPSPDVYAARDKQLRIRCYETALIHAALLKIDKGEKVENLDDNPSNTKKQRVEVLPRFINQLDVHTPGRITFAGHSFGACTTVQFLKSIFYHKERPSNAHAPLIVPTDSSLVAQVTPASPVLLLDLWTLPLRSPTQSWLLERSLPSYKDPSIGGKNILSVMSQAFFKWTGNFNDVRRAIAPPKNFSGPKPHLFYPATSQHFSQSDFGVLFPFLTSKFLKTEDPERLLLLNTRAMLQVLRDMKIEVADVGEKNLEGEKEETILTGKETVKGWVRVDVSDADGQNSGISIEQDKKQKPADDSEGMDM
jgi:platelet-activating factor acetylhydrolase